VFQPQLWRVFYPQLQADYRLFQHHPVVPVPPQPTGGAAVAATTTTVERERERECDGGGDSSDGDGDSVHLLPCNATLWYAAQDQRVGEAMVSLWGPLFQGSTQVSRLEGNHMFIASHPQKTAWLSSIVDSLHGDCMVSLSTVADHALQ